MTMKINYGETVYYFLLLAFSFINVFHFNIWQQLIYIATGVILACIMNRLAISRMKIVELLLGGSLSTFLLIGHAYTTYGTITIVSTGLLAYLLSWSSLTLYISIIIKLLFIWFDKNEKADKSSKISSFINKYIFLLALLTILIVGLPYIVFFYPGSVHWDGLAQLNMFHGLTWWDTQYPIISTLIMSHIFELGKSLSNDNLGVFMYTFIQFVISSFTLAYGISFLRKIKASTLMLVTATLFFALIPIWPMNGYTFFKETYYYLAFLLFVIELVKIEVLKENAWIKSISILLITTVIMCSFRSEGIYVLIITYISIVLLSKTSLMKVISISMILFIFIFNWISNDLIKGSMGIADGSQREKMSILIQQTGRVAKEHGDEISADDKKAIEDIINLTYQQIAKTYVPEHADDLKFKFLYRPSDEVMDEYLEVWLHQFFQYPITYLDAFLNNYYGYFYPLKEEFKDGVAWYSIQKSDMVFKGDLDLHMKDHYQKYRDFIISTNDTIRNLPVIRLIFNTGTYTWILLTCICYMLSRKKYITIIPIIPIVLSTMVVFISPVNALTRYMLPTMVTVFVLVTLAKSKSKNV